MNNLYGLKRIKYLCCQTRLLLLQCLRLLERVQNESYDDLEYP